MTDAQALQIWTWSLVAAGAVVAVAALLLIAIWRTAVGIEGLAGTALGTARRIVDNTTATWRLHDVKEAAADILDSARAIGAKGTALADAVEGHGGQGGAA